jgi:hypothetical protein
MTTNIKSLALINKLLAVKFAIECGQSLYCIQMIILGTISFQVVLLFVKMPKENSCGVDVCLDSPVEDAPHCPHGEFTMTVHKICMLSTLVPSGFWLNTCMALHQNGYSGEYSVSSRHF